MNPSASEKGPLESGPDLPVPAQAGAELTGDPSPAAVRVFGYGLSAATALILILISLGSDWTRAYRPRDPALGGEPSTAGPALGVWDSPVWLTAAYIATVLAAAALLALSLVEAPSDRPRLGALGYAVIAAQIVVVFAIGQREVVMLERGGFPETHFEGGFYVAIVAALASASALAFAIWQARGSQVAESSTST